ncbi:MAG: FG-GAP-like repeat-containing protein, partial [Thermoanaerobaculales bacterium]|nr:FG-GAP-like repeat-containing protein [Thermoanaerobaculales bacterium]
NGDGFADVVVGIPYQTNTESAEGLAVVFPGSAAGLSTTPSWFAESNQADAHFGMSVGTAGDVNGDGFADVVVGAPDYDAGQSNEGRAFVYHGASSWPSTSPDWTAESNQAAAIFATTVATAGDVNGDGYSDVIVGAPEWDAGINNEGLVALYHGSATGLSASADWSFVSDMAGAYLGEGAASAGDVNGDGYSDVIVGARSYDPGIWGGEAWVFHGSAGGLASTPAWTGDNDQASAGYGHAVATAGDVNGDGYADVVVGAHMYDNPETNEGRVSVYLGSASGLGSSAAWTAESDQDQSGYGWALGSAGDVNGDGYADLLVGAYRYDNGNTDEGRALLYYGNEGPGMSLRPRQRQADDSAPIAHLGASNDDGVRIAIIGRGPFGRTRSRLEVEVKPLGTLFDGAGTVLGASFSDTGIAGVALSETVSGLAAGTVHHWRSRLHYDPTTSPFLQYGPWLTMPWDGRQESDFRTPSCTTSTPPTITGSSSICEGESIVLNAGAGYTSYLWSPGGQTTQQITVSPSDTTVFTVWIKDGDGCDGTDDHTVTVYDNPSPTIIGPTSTCGIESIELDAGVGYESYKWGPGGEETRTITVSPSTTSEYLVEVVTSHGCSGLDYHTVTVYPASEPVIDAPEGICLGDTAELNCGEGFKEYKWSPGGETTRVIEVNPTITTLYTCTATTWDGCEGSDTHNLLVFAQPSPTIDGPSDACSGEPFDLDAGAGYSSYLWTPKGETTQQINATLNGSTTFGVTVTNSYGCEGVDEHMVTVHSNPSPTITGPDEIPQGENALLDAGAGYSSYLWSPGSKTTQQILVSPAVTTVYSVIVTNSSGCDGSDDHTLTVIEDSEIFSDGFENGNTLDWSATAL